MLQHARRQTRALVIAALALAIVAGLPSVASAATACPARTVSQPFLPWGDEGDYFLAPNGGFEDRYAAWTLSGRGWVSDGNERLGLTTGWRHLRLRDGASAASDAFCITSTEESVRFAVRNASQQPGATLLVFADVTYAVDGEAQSTTIPLGEVTGGTGSWEPSPIFRYGRFPTEDAELSIRFEAVASGGADWRVDALLVDPYRCC